MNMFAVKTKAKTPAGYIAELPEPRKGQVKALDAFIRKTVPSLKPYMQGGMIGYGKYHYVYASGREGDWSVVALASQKNYISLYICAVEDGAYVAEKYKKELPKADIGRSCIRFKNPEDLDLKVVANILKEAEKWFAKQGKAASKKTAKKTGKK